VEAQGHQQVCRRLQSTLEQATSAGETLLDMLTHVPRQVAAQPVAPLEHHRWTWATACPHCAASWPAAIETGGSPKAAVFGVCLALGASNVLAVVWAACRGVPGEDTGAQEGSLDDSAQAISTPSTGMRLAIPEPAWDSFEARHPVDRAAIWLVLARRVRLQACRKSPRTPKKPSPQGKKTPRKGQVSTAKWLMNRQANAATL
jgi:hypothetical protein